MIVDNDEKIHVIMRRISEGQAQRRFTDEFVEVDGPIVRATGYVFIYDPMKAQ